MTRLQIFSGAFIIRCGIGLLFLGGVDLVGAPQISLRALAGDYNSFGAVGNYFPPLLVMYWFGAFLMTHTPLPFALCYKILPIFFDSLLAVLIYDILVKRQFCYASSMGWLYAFSPTSILVTSVHFHWEPIFLFLLMFTFYVRDYFKKTYSSFFWAGCVFAASWLLKPVSLIFFPLIATPHKGFFAALGRLTIWLKIVCLILIALLIGLYGYFKITHVTIAQVLHAHSIIIAMSLSLLFVFMVVSFWVIKSQIVLTRTMQHYLYLQASVGAGVVAFFAISCLFFLWFGCDIMLRIEWILRYMNQGVQIFGLPCAYPFNQGWLHIFLKNRFWLMAGVGAVAWGYYRQRYSVYEAIAIIFAIILGCSGLGCQYLLWLVPWLHVIGWHYLTMWYTAITSLFLLFYNLHPYANSVIPYQCVSTFIPFSLCGWLAPSSWVTSPSLMMWISSCGNYLIPITCLIMVFMFYRNGLGHNQSPRTMKIFSPLRNPYALISIVIGLLIGLLYGLCRRILSMELFSSIATEKLSWYAMKMHAGRPIPLYNTGFWCNGEVLVMVWILAWVGAYCWVIRGKYV